MELDFIWIAVSDIEESVEFYNQLLKREPKSISERMAYYELENIGFGLYNSEYDGWTPEKRGDNTAPAFRVEDFQAEKERVQELVGEVDEYDARDHKAFLFTDPDGNGLEIYTWK
ncbi:MAG: VOC family protein [Candidatus Nanohalobium sp.]